MQSNSTPERGASAEAIQHHYDVGNDFYCLWLDRTLCYSCALWKDDPNESLERAQKRKLDYHAAKAKARGVGRVLDVGCGWGAMLQRLVERHGVGEAVGLTLSQEQADWIAARRHSRVSVYLQSWADHAPADPYDAVISIGAFEHFARPAWTDAEKLAAYRGFFERCWGFLKPSGGLSLQTIAYGVLDREKGRTLPGHPFLLEQVFPETDLPTLGEIVQASHGLFEIVTLRNDREDYRRTCRVWFEQLLARRAEAQALVGEAVVARFLRYLKFSATLFHYGHTHLLRIAFRRLDQ